MLLVQGPEERDRGEGQRRGPEERARGEGQRRGPKERAKGDSMAGCAKGECQYKLHFKSKPNRCCNMGLHFTWECCARDNTELAGVDDHRVSYFLSLCPQDVVFWNAGR